MKQTDLTQTARPAFWLSLTLSVLGSTALAQDAPPPIPARYQVIDLSPYTAIAMNDNGDVLLGDLYYDVNRSDNPGTRLSDATYYVWRDDNRDGEIDPVELQQVCDYQFSFTGSIKPEFSIRTYFSSSAAGCTAVAINNPGQVLALDTNATVDVVNCSDVACELQTTQRASARLWQDGSAVVYSQLLGIQDNGLGSTTQFLRLNSLDNLGRFTASGFLADPSFFGVTPFVYDNAQQFLPRTPGINRYSPIINDLGQVAFLETQNFIDSDGTPTVFRSASIFGLNNEGDVATRSGTTVVIHKADGTTISADAPELISTFQPFTKMNDQRQVALSILGSPGYAVMLQDDDNDSQITPIEFYDLRDRVGDQLPREEVRRVIDLNNRGQLLIRGEDPLDVAEGPRVRASAKDYLLKPEKPWLVMVALAYDDVDTLSANVVQQRIDELLNDLEAGANNRDVQVVAMVDTPNAGDSAYYIIKPDDDDTTVGDYEVGTELIELGELDITNPGALIQFVDWARKSFPASREILMLDGAGGPGGLMKDNTSLNAFGFMSMSQLQVALSEIGSQRRLELLVLNNPHLAMLEVGFSVREGARYMIASQTHIWHNQSSYRRMIERLPAADARVETQAVVTNLTQALGISRTFDTVSGPVLPVATSAVDLDLINGPLDLANLMALALNANLPLYAPVIQATLDHVQYFDTDGDLEQTQDDNLIDLLTFYIFLQNELQDAGFDPQTDPLFSDDLFTALESTLDYVVETVKTTNLTVSGSVGDSFGVSIFFPSKASHFYDAANYSYASGAIWNSGPGARKGAAQAPAWGELLVNYFALTDPGGTIESALPIPRVTDTLPEGATQIAIFSNGFE